MIQPALFAMNVGLAAVWRSLGLEPSAVVGHSQGEIAAAVVAGVLVAGGRRCRVVALRSRLLRGLSGRRRHGGDGACGGGGGRAAEGSGVVGIVAGGGEHAGLDGCLGPSEAVERWVSRLGQGRRVLPPGQCGLRLAQREMDPILPELEGLLSDLAPQAGQVPMVSTVTGARCEGASLDGAYWCRNLRQTVRLDLALAELIGDGHGVFVEASAHPVLAMPLSAAMRRAWRGGGIAASRWRRDVRSFCAIWVCCTSMALRLTGRRLLVRARERAGCWRFRPMRSSGSATGWRLRRRAGTSRRWGCRRRTIRCWELRRRWRRATGSC